jgi:3-oxoacyl-[acyl-carrier protein] reductase
VGQNVLVFGGSRGIGAAVAQAFAARGDRVTIVARTARAVEAAAQAVGARGLVADVADPPAVDAVFARTGAPDVTVHAAAIQGGAGAVGPLWETAPDAFAAVVRVNLLGTYLVLRAALRALRAARRPGTVIVFSGGGAAAPRPNFAAYGATKTAVVRLVETAALELRGVEPPIAVHALAPGAVRTAMTQEILDLGERAGDAETRQARRTAQDGGVPPGKAAELCLFLATPAARALAGRLIHVNEDWRALAARPLAPDAGCLRRIGYEP